MRKQFAAANWKMNLSFQVAEKLLDDILDAKIGLADHQRVIFAVPYPYLTMTRSEVSDMDNYHVAAQNCHHKKSGAFTGEISAEMLQSLGIEFCVVGHSERREYFNEDNKMIAEKIDRCFESNIIPIFCCGEPLNVREKSGQNDYVAKQFEDSLFHLDKKKIQDLVIAYEPIWAIGTGKTATADQAQEMHAHLRSILSKKFGDEVADEVSILYGGSVKGANAAELFALPDVDGGLVGGASLMASEFIEIINSLK